LFQNKNGQKRRWRNSPSFFERKHKNKENSHVSPVIFFGNSTWGTTVVFFYEAYYGRSGSKGKIIYVELLPKFVE
jgi:hypothetical protein